MPRRQPSAEAASATPDPPPRWPGRLGLVLAACGIAMLPWLVLLAVTLPAATMAPHWAIAWVGLDALEALGLVSTGILLRRGDPRCCLAATATAMLLITDAWFDLTTAAPGADLVTAIAMAAGAELPMAALCLTLAIRSVPRSVPRLAAHPAADGPPAAGGPAPSATRRPASSAARASAGS